MIERTNPNSVPLSDLQAHLDEGDRWKAAGIAIDFRRDFPHQSLALHVDPENPGAAP